jgi:hypothetical protein
MLCNDNLRLILQAFALDTQQEFWVHGRSDQVSSFPMLLQNPQLIQRIFESILNDLIAFFYLLLVDVKNQTSFQGLYCEKLILLNELPSLTKKIRHQVLHDDFPRGFF